MVTDESLCPCQCQGKGGEHKNCGGPAGEGVDWNGQQGWTAEGVCEPHQPDIRSQSFGDCEFACLPCNHNLW